MRRLGPMLPLGLPGHPMVSKWVVLIHCSDGTGEYYYDTRVAALCSYKRAVEHLRGNARGGAVLELSDDLGAMGAYAAKSIVSITLIPPECSEEYDEEDEEGTFDGYTLPDEGDLS